MKKIFFGLILTTGIVCISQCLKAQQVTTAKPPEVRGNVLKASDENKTPTISPAATDKDLHQTATKKSSFTDPTPVKAKEESQPAKAPETKPLPETNKIFPPGAKKDS